MDTLQIPISEQFHNSIVDLFQIENSVTEYRGSKLFFNLGKQYKQQIDEFWKQQNQNGYQKLEFIISCKLIVLDSNFSGLIYSVSHAHFNAEIPFLFYENHHDVGLVQILNPHFTSQMYQKHENDIGKNLENEVDYLIKKHWTNENHIEVKQNNPVSGQKPFDLLSFFKEYWGWIIVVGLAIYGFVVQHTD